MLAASPSRTTSFGLLFSPYSGVYKTRPNGSVVASFETFGTSIDCTYEGKRLWVCDGNRIYCYDVSNAPAVAPASLGKVKALFR